ncbi:hypothetical protein X778_07050 [Pseudomonas aeruginosa VRFPA07]|nr:hypothetical protein X778_07050 [Pseudomonas aeruginosa VRFPA07]
MESFIIFLFCWKEILKSRQVSGSHWIFHMRLPQLHLLF